MDPTWTIDQAAATLWYHPHLHGTTAEHVYRGVAGLFLLDDETSSGLELPTCSTAKSSDTKTAE